jgi:hypothetical protein
LEAGLQALILSQAPSTFLFVAKNFKSAEAAHFTTTLQIGLTTGGKIAQA